MRIVIVGGGVLGTMHAWQAVERGHHVVQIERDATARSASVRNFGLIWVGGRAEGVELETALRARRLWEEIAEKVPEIGFRATGSITVARTDAELDVARQALELTTAKLRGFRLLDAGAVRSQNPAVGGDVRGGLWCGQDAVVEPRWTQLALREHLIQRANYRWRPGREVRTVATGVVVDDYGDSYDADWVVVCPGAVLNGLTRELADDLPVRRVRLQMMQTEPTTLSIPTAIADADSFRYYPAYAGSALERLKQDEPQHGIAAAARMQLLLVQRADGSLTIGDTHAYQEPFDFDITDEPYQHLSRRAHDLLGHALPAVRSRWSGVYAETIDRSLIVHREQVADGVWLVMGPGGRGMTCAPAIAEQTMSAAGL